MKTPLLTIENLHVAIGNKPILKGLSLSMAHGEVHAIMGPNGTGKSTLAKVLAGHPQCTVESGDILFHGKTILNMAPEERAHAGLFVGFQHPVEIKGLTNDLFLYQVLQSKRKAQGLETWSKDDFQKLLDEKMALIHMRTTFKSREVNEGFSGGEKKKNELLQMMLLDPKVAIFDEIDSGLDIDALKAVSQTINCILESDPKKTVLLITHYPRILEYIHPTKVHVMSNGQIVHSGGMELAKELEQRGYKHHE